MTTLHGESVAGAHGRAQDDPSLIDRPRLRAKLDGLVKRGSLTVISAPAGSGKSVLLDQWASGVRDAQVVRLTIRATDDRRRLPARIVSGIDLRDGTERRLRGDPGQGAVRTDPAMAVLGALSHTADTVLILEAVDAPGDLSVIEELTAIIDHAPPGLRVVAATRSWWPQAIEQSSRRTEISRLDARDLDFTVDETRQLVKAVAGIDLTRTELDRLMALAQGWPAAVGMVALELRHVAPDQAMEELAGGNRHVRAYLKDATLALQVPEVRRFLMETSVLHHLDARLCDAVTGRRESGAMLHLLRRNGMFIRQTRGVREHFTYHPLFRELLRHELRMTDPARERQLLRRAGSWHAHRGDADDAAAYLIEAGAWDDLIELVDRYATVPSPTGRVDRALRWLTAIPPTAATDHAMVGLRRAYLETMAGNLYAAEHALHEVEAHPLSAGQRSIAETLRAAWHYSGSPPEVTLRAAEAAVDAIDRADPGTIPDLFGVTTPANLATMAALSRGRALWYMGELNAARRVLARAGRSDVYLPWRIHAWGSLALLEALAGNLTAAHETATLALTQAADAELQEHESTIDPRLALACVLRERGDLTRAARFLDGARKVAARTRRSVPLAMEVAERARWRLAVGEPVEGLHALRALGASGQPPPPPLVKEWLQAVEVDLLIALGSVEEANTLAARPLVNATPQLSAAGARAALAAHDDERARELLDGWSGQVLEPRDRLEHDLWCAIVDLESGTKRHAALRALAGVVERAATEGHVRLFLDGGPMVERPLRRLANVTPSTYLRRVLRLAGRQAADGPVTVGPYSLTQRELEVVAYLPTPLSSPEIAERLFISLNTLKTHLRTVYRKLGAESRGEAARRAQELGIA